MSGDFDKLVELTEKVIDAERHKDDIKDKLHKLLDMSSDGYWDYHIKDDYEYMSPRFWEIMGHDYTTKRHHPSEWQRIAHPDDLKAALANITKHIGSGGKHPFIQEMRFYRPDGSIIHILCRGRVVEWDDQGNAVRMVGTHTDLTHLKKENKGE
jgi:PAS domain S-box-containing protein